MTVYWANCPHLSVSLIYARVPFDWYGPNCLISSKINNLFSSLLLQDLLISKNTSYRSLMLSFTRTYGTILNQVRHNGSSDNRVIVCGTITLRLIERLLFIYLFFFSNIHGYLQLVSNAPADFLCYCRVLTKPSVSLTGETAHRWWFYCLTGTYYGHRLTRFAKYL